MSFRQAAQKAWKGTKKLQARTLGRIQAQAMRAQQSLSNSRTRIDFVLKLMTWRRRPDTRGVAARFLLSSMPKILDPTITMKISSIEDAKKVRNEIETWSKYEKTSTREMKARWSRILKYLNSSKSSTNNQVEIYSNGSEAVDAMWKAISEAKHRVWMTTYILKEDAVSQRTILELTKAAQRGAQVCFIYDHFGSLGFKESNFDDLKAAGGIVLCFNSLTSISRFFSFDFRSNYVLYRNHRKILVVDNEVGFCGGMNVAADYCGEAVGGNGRFRDTHASIRGTAVSHLSDVFVSTVQTMQNQNIPDWTQIMKSLNKKNEDLLSIQLEKLVQPNLTIKKERPIVYTKGSEKILPVLDQLVSSPRQLDLLSGTTPQGSFLQVLASNSRENKRAIQVALSETIEMSQKHVYLTSPYFLPPYRISRAIIAAAKRGVDVRILTAGKSDIRFITSASAHIYGLFLRNGVRVYELQAQELHAKTVTSDGAVAMVGSYNLDNLSYKHNLECNLNMVDSGLAVQLEKQFFEDLKDSKEVIKNHWENRSIFKRFWHWLVYRTFTLLLR